MPVTPMSTATVSTTATTTARRTLNEDQVDRDEDGTGDACDSTPRPTPADVCRKMTEYVVGSPKFAALSPYKKAALRDKLEAICDALERITPRLSPQHKAVLIRLQQLSVNALAHDGWLTSAQATELRRLISNM